MKSGNLASILYAIAACLFVICGITGGGPAFYGIAACFGALAITESRRNRGKN